MRSDAEKLFELARKHNVLIATAESCTGGMISAALTSISGSSDVFDRSFVTYSNDAKTEMIGVSPDTIAKHGAVSKEVAEEMAKGCLKHSHAKLSVSVTGIAGPTGGTEEKPVGTVYIATAFVDKVNVTHNLFSGDRESIRKASTEKAIKMMIEALS